MGFIAIIDHHLGEYFFEFFQVSNKQIQDKGFLKAGYFLGWMAFLVGGLLKFSLRYPHDGSIQEVLWTCVFFFKLEV